MYHRINNFNEIKAYVDVFNEHGHPGFKMPINPFFWWNEKSPGKVNESVHIFYDNGLIVILEMVDEINVGNMLVFSLNPQKNIIKRILDITKYYGNIIYNSEFRDKYRNITKKLDGASWLSNGKVYYSANGEKSWERLYNQL